MILVQKAIIKINDKYLIGLRSASSRYFPQHWDLPGGKLEGNEEPTAAVKREVKEETNLDVKPLRVVGIYEYDLDNKGYITHRFTIYSTEIIGGQLKISNEHTEQRWATKEEILNTPNIEPYFKPLFAES